MRPLVLYRVDPASTGADGLERVDPRLALLTATDLAATRGDGVFETIVVVDGVPQAVGLHLDRFARSAEMLDLPAPRRDLWQRAVTETAADLGDRTQRAAVKIVLSRGDEARPVAATGWALGFASEPPSAPAPELDVVLLDRGYRHDVAQTSPWLLQGAKTLSYAVNLAAHREARRRGAQDVIFTSSDGFVLEGPNSTVVARIDGVYVTPPTDLGVLAGTTQADVFAALEQWGEGVRTRAIMAAELQEPARHGVDALWLCSSTRGAAPVRSLDGAPWAVDRALTARINDALDARRG